SNKIITQEKIELKSTLIETHYPLLFQLLIEGITEIDLNNWKKHTDTK
ncbi:7199_t:CDS:1, partial [Gigaspora rosea]